MTLHRLSIVLTSSILFLGTTVFISCKKDKAYSLWAYENGEENSAGRLTVNDASENAYGHAIPGLSDNDHTKFVVGNSFNKMNWVIAPSSADGTDGLGPLFNARSCSGCHQLDGRGHAPVSGEPISSMVFRLSIPGIAADGGSIPVPDFGGQLGNLSIPGVTNEGGVLVLYSTINGTYPDGSPYTLRKPNYTFENTALSSVLFSPRVAPKMAGVGFIDAIPANTLESFADEYDTNGDGISGKVNYVWDETINATAIGRHGWKANTASTRLQVAHAFVNDIGITSSISTNENLHGSQITAYGAFPNGGTPEISDATFEKVYFYTSTLSVPARRNVKNDQVLNGKYLFNQIGCAKCHTPKMETGTHPDIPYLNNITIRPYSDFLLHDMGNGLTDGRTDYLANGNEWRTTPLWGIGLQQTVNGHMYLLHDGRANGLEEAILWHEGEASSSKNKFMNLTIIERNKIIKFLNSL